jgi:hypothetical protein
LAYAHGWRARAFKAWLRGFPLEKGQHIDLVIIPTAGTNKQDYTTPDEDGLNRIRKGIEAIGSHRTLGAIIGDYPDCNGLTLAQKYMDCLVKISQPWIHDSVKLVGGIGNNTVLDILSVQGEIAEMVRPGGTIGIATDWWHARRIALVLYSLGYEVVWLKSQDEIDRSKLNELILFFVGWTDPQWQGRISAKLSDLAQNDADKYREDSKRIVLKSPD